MNKFYIVSGEGEGPGTTERYTGQLTGRAIKSRLTRERCNGDRWAYVMLETEDRHRERLQDDDLDVVL